MFQGILYGYITSLKFLLKSKGTSYQMLSLFDLVNSPAYFKFFFAPILDIYYSKKLGKRMTYITFLSVISVILFGLLAIKSDGWIKTQDIWSLTATTFTLMVAICVQDVAIDSLVEEVFNESHTKFGPLMQTIGQIIGPLVSFNVFIYFYTSHPHLSFYLPLIFGLFILVSTIWVRYNVSENESEPQFDTPLDLVRILPNFFKNKNLRLYIFYILTYELGIGFWRHVSPMIMFDLGFKMSDVSALGSTETLWAIVSIFILFQLKLNQDPFKFIKWSYLFTILSVVLDSLIVRNLEITKNVGVAYTQFLYTQPLLIAMYIDFSAKSTFNNMICDYALSGTFLSVLNSLCNFSKIFFQPFFSFSLSYFDYKYLVIVFILYSIVYRFVIMPKIFGKLSKLKREDFSVTQIDQGKKDKTV